MKTKVIEVWGEGCKLVKKKDTYHKEKKNSRMSLEFPIDSCKEEEEHMWAEEREIHE